MTSIINRLAANPIVFSLLRRILENNYKGERQIINEHFALTAHDKILDLSCGTGDFARLFPSSQYTGLDINRRYIAYARRHHDREFVIGDGKQLPLAENLFTKVLIIGLLHHLDDQSSLQILSEAARVLTNDGRLLLMEDLHSKDHSLPTRILHMLDKGENIRSHDGYSRLIEASPFRIILEKFTQSGICPYYVVLCGNKQQSSHHHLMDTDPG